MANEIKVLKALANKKRMEILRLLEYSNELDVIEIADEIRLHYKSTSKHLQRLAEAGLLDRTRKGFRVNYSLKPKIDRIIKAIREF